MEVLTDATFPDFKLPASEQLDSRPSLQNWKDCTKQLRISRPQHELARGEERGKVRIHRRNSEIV